MTMKQKIGLSVFVVAIAIAALLIGNTTAAKAELNVVIIDDEQTSESETLTDEEREAYEARYEEMNSTTRERVEAFLASYGLSYEDYVAIIENIATITLEEVDAFYLDTTGVKYQDASRFAYIEERYRGENKSLTLETPELLQENWDAWIHRLESLLDEGEETAVFYEMYSFYDAVLEDGMPLRNIVGQPFDDGAERTWLEFLKNVTVDEDGYLVAHFEDSYSATILAGYNIDLWVYNFSSFDERDLAFLPRGEEKFGISQAEVYGH